MKFKVEYIDACDPINSLLTILQEKGFVIEKSNVSDYHFNELYFLMKGKHTDNDITNVNIENISMYSPDKFYCECHWSIVELNKNE